ncbi:hypothetical protein L3Q67_00945 [Saccharothrix sp. AJ9571]|nr:hypothetical protein L3Q67_00945 [Saccharothrix sp. AJ9571]
MAFPQDELDLYVELYYGGVWNDITTHTFARGAINHSRGRGDWAKAADPSRCTLILDNSDGRYSRHNPASPLYGLIGRNTPIQVRVGPPRGALLTAGRPAGSGVTTPDAPSLGFTGDHDVRIDVTPRSWRPQFTGGQTLASKYLNTGDQRSWLLAVLATGKLELMWSPDGTLAARLFAASTVAVPESTRRLAVRATLDVNNGGGGRTVTFYTAPTIAGPWTPLGAPVTAAGVTSVKDGTATLAIGAGASGAQQVYPNFIGRTHAFELRNGIDGTVVAAADFSARRVRENTPFTDSTGLVWTMHGTETGISDESVRFSGEVSNWPVRWDPTGTDVSVQLDAASIRRRLSQGASPLRSTFFRAVTNAAYAPPVAYWPCEEESGATQLASEVEGVPPLQMSTFVSGTSAKASLGAYSGFECSEPIPQWNNTFAWASIPTQPATGELRAFMLLHTPEAGVPQTVQVLNLGTSGSTGEWQLLVDPAGSMQVVVKDPGGTNGATIYTSTWVGFQLNNRDVWAGLWLKQVGSAIEWQMFAYDTDITKNQVWTETLPAHTFGHATKVLVANGGDLGSTAIGHVGVINNNTADVWGRMAGGFRAWRGETAGARLERIATEEQIPLALALDPDFTDRVGAQRPIEVLDLLDAAAAVDLGMLTERRDALGMVYLGRARLYNQEPRLVLDYEQGHISEPFEPEDDDQALRNDITVKREQGSSARAVAETGPVSVLPPPAGVGRYEESVTINAHSDSQLEPHAGWRLHLGTVDELRVASVHIDLKRNPQLIDAVTALDTGDLIRIENLPAWMPPGPLDLIVQGYRETLKTHEWDITVNTTPASAWRVAETDSDDARADTAGSQLAAAVTSSATSLLVSTTVGPIWTTSPAEFPFDLAVGGEHVTAVAAADGAADAFTRTVAAGWGTAPSGQVWTVSGGAAADFSVSGGQGLVSQGTTAANRWALLPLGAADADVTATVGTNKAAVGGIQLLGLMARASSTANYYLARPVFETSGAVTLYLVKRVAGAESVLTAVVVPGLTHVAGARYGVRLQVIGSRVRGKVWAATAGEPVGWTLTATDTALAAPGGVGCYQQLGGGSSNAPVTVAWDDLRVVTPQSFTVVRSVNGITKPHAAGADVRLAHPAIVAL